MLRFSMFAIFCFYAAAIYATSSPPLGADAITQKIYQRAEAPSSKKIIKMQLIDGRGKRREQRAVSIRWQQPQMRKILFAYQAPRRLQGTRFLTHEFLQSNAADNQWLYLPALRKTRRISPACSPAASACRRAPSASGWSRAAEAAPGPIAGCESLRRDEAGAALFLAINIIAEGTPRRGVPPPD